MTYDASEGAPRSVTVGVWLAGLTAVIGLVASVVVAIHAGANADSFVRQHPSSSRTAALIGSYVGAAVLLAVSVLMLVAAVGLRRARRWAWLVLIVLSALGLLQLGRVRSALALLENVPNVALLVALLVPATRAFVQDPEAQRTGV